jgi:hypothetical protein
LFPVRLTHTGVSTGIIRAPLYGAYGEAHPSTTAYFQHGQHLPHTPLVALVLVAVATVVLCWRRRWPIAVLCHRA